MRHVLIVGCGLSGAVVARELAENGYNVLILERRDHIGGNMYDYVDDYGILVHKYGPHTFHTREKELYDYICKYGEWKDYKLTCGAEINGICTPTPFNFQTIDDFYSPNKANRLKEEIKKEFHGRTSATVLEVLECKNKIVHDYAQFLFDNDYSLYCAKQWGIPPSKIDPSIFKRVPLRFNYEVGYFDEEFQVMPKNGYTAFFENLLDHENITIELKIDALKEIKISEGSLWHRNEKIKYPVVYTGPIDELFNHKYGELPYRSLRFEWVHEEVDSKQNMPVVAYPQDSDIVRIIEYKKLPIQKVAGSTYEREYSLPYKAGEKNEPYYPLLTEASKKMYIKYSQLAKSITNLYVCGRLGNYKYYNMDQTLEMALNVSKEILSHDSLR